MYFTNLKLNNFGPYKGLHEFQFKPEGSLFEKPVILVGGLNGSGKTKLFQAIKLCLYGSSSIGAKLPITHYHNFLRDCIHKANDERAIINASIGLEFEHSTLGRTETYSITRNWKLKDDKVIENFFLLRNGEPISNLSQEQWQDFLKELVPPGLSNLFFFDGEKIEHLAESGTVDNYIKVALSTLLGLDIIEQLQSDLTILAAKNAKELGEGGVHDKLVGILEKKGEVEDRIEQLEQELASKNSNLDYVNGQMENWELKLSSQGGKYYERREFNLEKLSSVNKELDLVKEEVRRHVTETFPFLLCPSITASLLDRLKTEEEQKTIKSADAAIGEFSQSLSSELENKLSKTAYKQFQATLKKQKKNLTSAGSVSLTHDLSHSEITNIHGWIEQSHAQIKPRMEQLATQFESLVRQKDRLSMALKRVPRKEGIGETIAKLIALSEKTGSLQTEIENLELELAVLNEELVQYQREEERSSKDLDGLAKLGTGISLNRKVNKVLEEYLAERRSSRLDILEENIVTSINDLARKDDLIRKIHIDSDTYTIETTDQFGTAINRKHMSAGERQIFAVALLWALARTARRDLPFIIDTPLSRLDSKHREKFVNKFLTKASPQLIIFSTDTEVDQAFYSQLGDHISHSYHLDYDQATASTTVRKGYFWGAKA